MRGNEFQINYGGEWLDVDAQSVGGFDFTTLWTLDSTRITEKGRTLDLSVPATSKNTRVFNDHKLIPGDGVRRGINGMVVAGGVNITGIIYVTEYSGGRYSLMMAYGQSFGGFKRVNYAAAFAADTMTLIASDVPQSGGVVPDFGWYDYGNETAPHATVYSGGALLFPSVNLGHIIDALAASLGYTVNYPHPILGRGYQAHAYGLVLPSFGVDSIQGGADVSGSAMNGFSYTMSGVATLADLGLEVVVQKRARGVTLELVDCEVFRATKPVHITIPANSNVVVFGNNSYTLYNDWEGTQGAEFDLSPGDTFSFAKPDEWHKVAGEYYWNRYKLPPAFEGNVTVTFSVTRGTSNPIPGETMRLAAALPEHPLEWWLDAYCNIIFAAWTVDESTKTITVKTYGERYGDALADAGNHISLEKEKVIAIESVKKYVNGFAQRNHTRCDGKYDNLGSVLPFDRVLEMDNEYLEQSRDMASIPFNDGGIQGGHDDRFYLYLNDVRPDGEGGYTYDGVLTVFFENNVNTDGAVSLQEILNLGVGLSFGALYDIPGSLAANPNGYDNDYVAQSLSNMSRAYTDTTSTTYASIGVKTGSQAETYVFFDFPVNIPLTAQVVSVGCKVKALCDTTVYVTTRQAQLFVGTLIAKGSPTTLSASATVRTMTTGTWTAAEVNNLKLRIYGKRGTSNVTTGYQFRVYGADLDVEYIDKGIRHHIVASASSSSVRLRLPLFRFAGISGGTCVSLHGRDFVVRNAKWSEGVAQLDMVTFPLEIPEVTPPSDIPLNFTMPNGGDITLTRYGNPTEVTLEYSLDNGSTWTEWTESGNVRTLTLSAGGRVWLRNQSGTSTGFSTGAANYYNFGFSDVVNANGDTRSLLCALPFAGIVTNYCFFALFMDCVSLVTAPELPATTLADYCYYEMFYDCTSLVTAPELPATTMTQGCYSEMFMVCTSLVNAPELPATTLADNCYRYMFYNCTNLITAPELPATTLADGCYYGMFQDCTGLVTAPQLPAATLADNCYFEMFYECTSLDEVTMLAIDMSANNCLRNWLYNVAASGTLHLDSRLTGIPVDSPSGIPVGWIRNNL